MKIILLDIDYTIIPFDSFFKFVFYSLKKYPLNVLKIPKFIVYSIAYLFKVKNLKWYKEKWLELFEHFDEKELNYFSEIFTKKNIIPYLKEGVVDFINDCKEKGYKIILATASFEFYLKYLSQYLNADYFFGTKIKRSGKKIYIDGENCKGIEKIKRIQEVINEKLIDKENSLGFSDSMSDKFYCLLVKNFYLVNKKKWKTKDMKNIFI